MPNIGKDEKAKNKVVTLLKNMYEDITGKDIKQDDIDKKADVLSLSEAYNSTVNPELKKKNDDEFSLVMD